MFVPKVHRKTIEERDRMAREEEERELERVRMLEQARIESSTMVADAVRRELEELAKAEREEDELEMPDDTDDPADESEFDAWRIREMKRLQRDVEARRKMEAEAAEVLRRRGLTEEERAAEDAELERRGLKVFAKEKVQWNFLQRYYHKGAFYQDDDTLKDPADVRKRTLHAATGEDVFDKTALPAIMQVKKFGLKGRTKWTHLTAEDTTDTSHPWSRRAKQGEQRG